MRQFTIAPEHAGLSVEDYVTEVLQLGPRSALKRAFAEKAILVGAGAVRRQDTLSAGDTLKIATAELFTHDELIVAANPLPLEVIVEAKDLIVINKPSGINAHPIKPTERDTALNGLVSRYPETGDVYVDERPLEGGLIHRIDRGTSGLLVCARTADTFKELRAAWSSREVVKVYLAWLSGELVSSGTFDCHLFHDPKSKKRMLVSADEPTKEKSWPARTSLHPLKSVTLEGGKATLALIRIHTGVTHQIRAVMAHLGHPIMGDTIYRAKTRGEIRLEKLDRETSNVFDEAEAALKEMPQAPNQSALPAHGFFLHALFLRVPASEALARGIFSAAPPHFIG